MMRIQFQRMVNKFGSAKTPFRATQYSAGYDLSSFEDMIIPDGETVLIPTGIKINFPDKNIMGKIYDRSSLARGKKFVSAGVIDPDYTGEIKVNMTNNSGHPFHISYGDRIAQIVFHKIEYYNFEEVDNFENPEIMNNLENSDFVPGFRGEGGFGSTGIN